jgi:hypothetical protein
LGVEDALLHVSGEGNMARARFAPLLLSSLALIVATVSPALSVSFFTEDFNGTAITAELEYPTG